MQKEIQNQVAIIKIVRQWLEQFVIELNLCPFAKRELHDNKIRFSVSTASSSKSLLSDFKTELELLNNNHKVETTLLILENVLQDFYDYNDFLKLVDKQLKNMQLDGVYQIASFHPNYQFAGTEPDDVENYTNKSPYPILHILREDGVSLAISKHPNTGQIPQRNIELMKSMGKLSVEKLMKKCLSI